MAQRQFNLKLDAATADALKRVAQQTQRSRAGVVRWLILAEAARLATRATSPAATTQEVIIDPIMA
jgi:hypothetical protein